MAKDFRTFTSAIPLKDKTVVLFSEEGFANTVEEKIELARSGDDLYVAWPGEYETHVFAATAGQILGALVPPTPEFAVGDLVRVAKPYGRAAVGLVGVVRVLAGLNAGVEFAGFRGHTLKGALKTERGYWIPAECLEAA